MYKDIIIYKQYNVFANYGILSARNIHVDEINEEVVLGWRKNNLGFFVKNIY